MQFLTSPLRVKWSLIREHLATIFCFIFSKMLLIGGISMYTFEYMHCSAYLLELCAGCDKIVANNADEVCRMVSSGFGGYGILLALVIGYLTIDLIMGCTMLMEEDQIAKNQDMMASYWLEPLLFNDGVPVLDHDGTPILKVIHNGAVAGLYKPMDFPKPMSVAKPMRK